jgi:heptosyltransferase-2
MKKILLVKLSSLGDVIASTPFFRLLAEDCGLSVDHLVMEHCKAVSESNPHVNRQLAVGTFPSGSRIGDVLLARDLVCRLRGEKYDAALVLHRSPLLGLLCRLSGIGRVYGLTSGPAAPAALRRWRGAKTASSLHDILLDEKLVFSPDVNRTLQEYELIKKAGFDIRRPEKLEFYIDRAKVDPKLLAALPERFISSNPGGAVNVHAAMKSKKWPSEKYAELYNRLDLPVALLGHGPADAQVAAEISAMCPKVISLVNATNFHEAAAVIERSALYVGNDSSLVYLAAAVGTGTLALYGPTQRSAFNPLGPRQFYVESATQCSPCYNPLEGVGGRAYHCEDNRCMKSIPVAAVLEEIRRIMGTAS